MRVTTNLVEKTVEIIFRPICMNCGGQLRPTSYTKNSKRKYQDISLECPDCGGIADVREDRLQRVIQLNKKFKVQRRPGVA